MTMQEMLIKIITYDMIWHGATPFRVSVWLTISNELTALELMAPNKIVQQRTDKVGEND